MLNKFVLQVLRLSQATLGGQTVGRIVNLASNDVQRFDRVGYYSCSMDEAIMLLTVQPIPWYYSIPN